MNTQSHARPAAARRVSKQIRTAVVPSQTKAWKPEPSAISRAEMREIIIRMIG